jgi:hypothetical protein
MRAPWGHENEQALPDADACAARKQKKRRRGGQGRCGTAAAFALGEQGVRRQRKGMPGGGPAAR